MRMIAILLRSARWLLPVAVVTSLASGFGNAALVAVINTALDAPATQLASLGLRFGLLGVLVLVTRVLSQTLFMYLGQRTKATLRMQTIRRIVAATYPDIEKCGAARPLGVLTQDLDTIVVFFVSLPAIATQGAVIAGCLIYLGTLSWPVLVSALIAIGIGALGFRMVNGPALLHLRGSRRREDDLIRQFRALFDGAKELKLHGARREAFVDQELAPHVEAVRVQRTRGYVLNAAAASWGNLVLFAFIGLTIFVLARRFGADAHVMSGFTLVFLYLIMPVESLLSALPTISSARVALERIDQLRDALPQDIASRAAADKTFSSIALDGVTHRYFREKENGVFLLGPIDFTFRPGEIVYLIGGNGSGKTTLAKLLVGLYAPEDGRILLDGRAVDAGARESYRHLFSVVFSDFFLFESLLGLPSGSEDAARALLIELHLDHKVRIENGAFSTLDLSQGQRKRLALLVAYLEDRPFYVFDEWAADQDPVFKDVFYRTMLPELKSRGKAVLVITHDDRYFDLADRTIKLDSGHLVDEMAQPDPTYAVAMQ
ncbi:cyclic peptide export ABC transporter [Pararobbsia silviterrae]|uniref:Cyclic peptide export ABC transporter n=1 Tax=Pararobbsia silviterrae TaxID=1792498 RepID=A0A494XZ98_9BURK|nr:cyclic peptide export ABC transporter [Pararobbsia silviterrae]RKP53484.1 cyclic peptide export ABC transporter [Pararobbsia silviterrae]